MLGILTIVGLLFFVASICFLLISLDWVVAVVGLAQTTDLNATLLSGIATLLSISAALFAAVLGLQNQRAVNRRRHTIDFINQTEKDGTFVAALQTFVTEAKSGNLVESGNPEQEGSKKALDVRLVLNHFEIVALGIDNGVFDDKLYQKWFKSGTILYWEYASEFVTAIRSRSKYNKSFTNFEKLAIRYKKTEEESDSRIRRWYNTVIN
ncbi:DUF4760 domain-containing protein [Stappia sp. BW2]|uniref:DUF4760 domain-containing protein n=1 Tax=Stappia sp. BW2 TaxID=2592622 RepID=UPI0013967BC1|nr:DUF4760 domain-containing protein [Stappia sp. BW2]